MNKILMFYGVFVLTISLVLAVSPPGIHESEMGLENPELVASVDRVAPVAVQKTAVQGNNVRSVQKQQIAMREQKDNKIKLSVGDRPINYRGNLTYKVVQNRTKLYLGLSNGRNAELKIMPDVASRVALQRLRLKNCNESNNCTIELKEVGAGNRTSVVYALRTRRRAKFLGLFNVPMNVEVDVDVEDGEIVRVNKPWWAFLASEPEE